jgi:hypothetical protein
MFPRKSLETRCFCTLSSFWAPAFTPSGLQIMSARRTEAACCMTLQLQHWCGLSPAITTRYGLASICWPGIFWTAFAKYAWRQLGFAASQPVGAVPPLRPWHRSMAAAILARSCGLGVGWWCASRRRGGDTLWSLTIAMWPLPSPGVPVTDLRYCVSLTISPCRIVFPCTPHSSEVMAGYSVWRPGARAERRDA